ncbi:hypothetical protein [Vibrio furnissii]|uniref:hypothetical protein n=1 Tax=Vibrio furnissii TaxID=29494 RepID=UPI001EEA7530|nr:hypothetical protein [Vibrio furnissii]MCG6269662.1 hypothetical protein [Vibrio furnissii]
MNIGTHNDLLSKFTNSSILAIKREFPFSYLYTFFFIIRGTITNSLDPLMIAVLPPSHQAFGGWRSACQTIETTDGYRVNRQLIDGWRLFQLRDFGFDATIFYLIFV